MPTRIISIDITEVPRDLCGRLLDQNGRGKHFCGRRAPSPADSRRSSKVSRRRRDATRHETRPEGSGGMKGADPSPVRETTGTGGKKPRGEEKTSAAAAADDGATTARRRARRRRRGARTTTTARDDEKKTRTRRRRRDAHMLSNIMSSWIVSPASSVYEPKYSALCWPYQSEAPADHLKRGRVA